MLEENMELRMGLVLHNIWPWNEAFHFSSILLHGMRLYMPFSVIFLLAWPDGPFRAVLACMVRLFKLSPGWGR